MASSPMLDGSAVEAQGRAIDYREFEAVLVELRAMAFFPAGERVSNVARALHGSSN